MKTFIRWFFGLLFVMGTLTSCSHTHLVLKGTYKLKGTPERVGNYTFQKTYRNRTLTTLCVLTGYFFGGTCYGLLTLPTQKMKKEMEGQARTLLLASLKESIGEGLLEMTPLELREATLNEQEPKFTYTYKGEAESP